LSSGMYLPFGKRPQASGYRHQVELALFGAWFYEGPRKANLELDCEPLKLDA
jgi:hypothetical protein